MEIKKRLLILTDGIHPPLNAPRMRNLYNNLCQDDSYWQAVLLTDFADKSQIPTLFCNPENVHQLNYLPPKNTCIWFFEFLLNLIFKTKEREIIKIALKLFKTQCFDVILCSTSNIFPLYAAVKLSKKTKVPLIIDFRDITEQYAQMELTSHSINFWGINYIAKKIYAQLIIAQRNKLIGKASLITSISNWHVSFLEKLNQNATLIYNGFDEKLFFPNIIRNKKFIITYTGRLSESRVVNLQIFFSAVKLCVEEQKITSETFEIQWFIPKNEYDLIDNLVQKNNLQKFNNHYAIVPNNEVPNTLHNSSLLLLLTANSNKGVMTTKFYEYLGVEKPVLCVMSDEGELEKVIRETNAGIAAQNLQEIKDFIVEQYNLWKQQGYTQMPVNQKIKKQFSRTEQAKQFVEIFDKLITI